MSKVLMAVALSVAAGLLAQASRAQNANPPSPKDFVMAASQSDQYEIQAARVAEVEAVDPRIKSFAQQMVLDHTHSNEDIRQAAFASGFPPPPPGMSSDQAAFLSGLQSVRGPNFDRTYARQQALAHAQAAAVEESFATAGADPNLRKAAQSALPMIHEHLRMAQQLRDQVGP
jgi:putative membrane protein